MESNSDISSDTLSDICCGKFPVIYADTHSDNSLFWHFFSHLRRCHDWETFSPRHRIHSQFWSNRHQKRDVPSESDRNPGRCRTRDTLPRVACSQRFSQSSKIQGPAARSRFIQKAPATGEVVKLMTLHCLDMHLSQSSAA